MDERAAKVEGSVYGCGHPRTPANSVGHGLRNGKPRRSCAECSAAYLRVRRAAMTAEQRKAYIAKAYARVVRARALRAVPV